MVRSKARWGGSILMAGTIGLGFALAAPARAADDGYANVFSSLLSATGVIKPDPAPDINYRERPPLVLPPQPGLPKPKDGAKRTAGWPQDPDVLAHRKALEDARAPREFNRDDQVTSAAELAKRRAAAAEGGLDRPAECNNGNNSRTCLLLSPEELKRQGDAFAAANADRDIQLVPGKEPERLYLTQPPKGYMVPTHVVKATAEAPLDRSDPSDPRAFLREKPKTDE